VWRVGNLLLAAVCAGWALHLLHLTFLTVRNGRHRDPISGLRWSLLALAGNTLFAGLVMNSNLGDPHVSWKTGTSSVVLVVTFIAVSSFKPRDLFRHRLSPQDLTGPSEPGDPSGGDR
jgi:hypothetical protein